MSRVRLTRGSIFSGQDNTLFDFLGDFPDIDGLFVRFVDVLREGVLTSSGFISTLRLMTDNRFSGLALIVGSVGSIITMVFHPTGHDLVAPGRFESMAQLTLVVHALALASMPVLFCGALGLSRHLAIAQPLVTLALVTYAAAVIAVMNAATFSGLVAPALVRQILAGPPASETWRIAFQYNGFLNQAFAAVFTTASSAAIILWSIAILRNRALARAIGIYGCVLGPITLGALFSGHLRPDVHGFGLVIFGQASWFSVTGVLLRRHEEP